MVIRPVGTDFFHARRLEMQTAFIGDLRHILQFCERASNERMNIRAVSRFGVCHLSIVYTNSNLKPQRRRQ